ncbi:MAG: ECF transporter S component [Candidatus Asgardarchaeia archaeon]
MAKGGSISVSTRDVVLMGLGAALYAIFGSATVFIPVGGMSLRPAIAIVSFFGAVYGPIVGFVVGAVGNLILDFTWGSFWWNWDVGVGIIGLFPGIWWVIRGGKVEESKDLIMTSVLGVIGCFVGLFFAGIFDILAGFPFEEVIYAWVIPAAVTDAVFVLILTPILIRAYNASRPRYVEG